MTPVRRRVTFVPLPVLAAVLALAGSVAPASPSVAADPGPAEVPLTVVGGATFLVTSGGTVTASQAAPELDHATLGSDGRVYASKSFDREETAAGIFRIEPDGEATRISGDRWVMGMASDGDDLVYAKNRCAAGSATGKKVARIVRRDIESGETEVVADDLPALDGIAVEEDGDVVAVEDPNQFCGTRSPGSDSLFRISADDGEVTTLASDLQFPTDVAVESDGFLLVTSSGYTDLENDTEDMDSGAVLRFPAAGGEAVGIARVSFPQGLDVAPDGTVYTAGLSYNGDYDSIPTGTVQQVTPGGDVTEVLDAPPSFDDVVVGSTVRDPRLLARRVSDGPRNEAGWYRSPVTVEFTCRTGSAPLEGDCPRPVRLGDADRTVRRSITATDGGSDSVSVRVRVDTTAPGLEVRRVGEPPFPASARPMRCRGFDSLSGVDGGCSIRYGAVRTRENGSRYRTWTATVRDVAGNVTTEKGSFAVRR